MAAPTLVDVFFRLGEGVASNKHDYHLMTMASCADGLPHLRMVVLRSAERTGMKVSFHTDLRSPKVAQLRAEGRVECHFYHRASKQQIRAGGMARVHVQDALTQSRWERTSASARRCYLSELPPGEALPEGESNLPLEWREAPPSREESEAGYANFGVVEIALDSIDLLELNATGHSRWRLEQGVFVPVVP